MQIAILSSTPTLFKFLQDRISTNASDCVLISYLARSIHLRLLQGFRDKSRHAAQAQEIHSMLLSDITSKNQENEAWAAFFTGALTHDSVWLIRSLKLEKDVLLRMKSWDLLAEIHLQSGEGDMAIACMRERVQLACSLGTDLELPWPEWLAKAEFVFATFHLCRFYVHFLRFREAADTCDQLGALAQSVLNSLRHGNSTQDSCDILVIALHSRLCGHLAAYMGDFKESIRKNKLALDLLLRIHQNMDPLQIPFNHIYDIKQCISHALVEIRDAERATGSTVLDGDSSHPALVALVDKINLGHGPAIIPEEEVHALENRFHVALQGQRLEEAETIVSEMLLKSLFLGMSPEICNALMAAATVATVWASMSEQQESKSNCLQVAQSFLDEAVNVSSPMPRVECACQSAYAETLFAFNLHAQARQRLEKSLRLFMRMERDPQSFGSFSRGRIAYLESVKHDFRRIQLALFCEEILWLGLVWAERGRSRDLLYGISNSIGRQLERPAVSTLGEFDENDAEAWNEIRSLCAVEEDTVFLVYTQLDSLTVLNYFVHASEQASLIARLDMDPLQVDRPVPIFRFLVYLMENEPERADTWLETLYDIFISKWSERLQKIQPKKVVIVAGEALALLPFAAFRDKDDEHTPYLIQKYEIVNVPSLRLFQYCKLRHEFLREQGKAGRGLVIGDPGCNLYFAQEEARYVARVLDDKKLKTTVLEREDATKEAILDQLVTYDWVHISCHGQYSESYPFGSLLTSSGPGSSSGSSRVLNLTPPTAEATYARITGREVLRLKEDMKARCVVLSACQTGQGESGAEGVLNLVRDFHLAGVPAVVASLWEVDDEVTCNLMKGLYKFLQEGKQLSTALQGAMVDLINETDDFTGLSSVPVRKWAPFVISGAPSVTL